MTGDLLPGGNKGKSNKLYPQIDFHNPINVADQIMLGTVVVTARNRFRKEKAVNAQPCLDGS